MTALALFISATRNCQRVDIRSNPRLSAQDGRSIARALLANFASAPAPRFLTTPPPPPPAVDLADEDAVARASRLQQEAIANLRAAIEVVGSW